MAKFSDIPQFVHDGNWQCYFDLHRVWEWVDSQSKDGPVDLNPPFQRAHVWSEAQQIAWLEFHLRGGKTGRVIYFNHPYWGNFSKPGTLTIVDGKQRLEAIRRFIGNEIPVFGNLYRDHTDSPRVRQGIEICVNTLKTDAEVVQWYIDMNAGGTPHTNDEIEKARHYLSELQRQGAE